MLLASLGPAVPAQAFHGCGYDGYQPLLEHGKVFTATLTSNGCYWAPFAGAWKPDPGGPDTVNVGVRVRGSARRSRPAYLRIIPASRRCAASASRGAGDPLGWFPLSGPGSIATGVVRIKRGLFPTPSDTRLPVDHRQPRDRAASLVTVAARQATQYDDPGLR